MKRFLLVKNRKQAIYSINLYTIKKIYNTIFQRFNKLKFQ
jgi:hypothetical protein